MPKSEILVSLDAESYRTFTEAATQRGTPLAEAIKQMALERARQIIGVDEPSRARDKKGGA